MSLIIEPTLSPTDYTNLLDQMLKDFEGAYDYAYTDPSEYHYATIGIGFKISSDALNILEGMGYSPASTKYNFSEFVAALTAIGKDTQFPYVDPQKEPINPALQAKINDVANEFLGTAYGEVNPATGKINPNFGYLYNTNNPNGSETIANAQMKQTLKDILPTYKKELNAWLADTPYPNMPDSRERAALLSLTYNNLISYDSQDNKYKSPTLHHAILTGDRAEAWYQIRYVSNGNHSSGIARRRYEESQIFGLFNDPSDLSLSGAIQAYQMVTAHRTHIEQYDQKYSKELSIAYASSATANIPAMQSLQQTLQGGSLTPALEEAVNLLMGAINNTYGSLLSGFKGLTPLDGLSNSADIYLNPGRASSYDSVSTSYDAVLNAWGSSDNSILIGSAGVSGGTLVPDTGSDTLVAGSGNDVLIAGAGQDFLEAGSGSDTLIGGLGDDTMYAGSGQDTFDDVAAMTGAPSTVTIYDSKSASANDVISVVGADGTQTTLAGGTNLKPIGTFQWQSGSTIYTFKPTYVNAAGQQLGTLTISQGAVSSGEIVIKDFNLSTAGDL